MNRLSRRLPLAHLQFHQQPGRITNKSLCTALRWNALPTSFRLLLSIFMYLHISRADEEKERGMISPPERERERIRSFSLSRFQRQRGKKSLLSFLLLLIFFFFIFCRDGICLSFFHSGKLKEAVEQFTVETSYRRRLEEVRRQ